GLVQALLEDDTFAVRAITRNVKSEKAKALAASGVEVVAGNLDDLGSMKQAFEGAYGAFCVTNFWEHFSAEKEQAQVRVMANAAKAAGVKHVIWSTLEDTRKWIPLSDNRMPTLQGKYKVPHFDAKGEINHVFTDAGLPTTFLNTSFYWDNAYLFGMGPAKQADGSYTITFPMGDKRLSGIASEDIGKCAYGIFKNPGKYIGKTVGIAGDHLTGAQMAEKYSKGLGINCKYNEVTPDVYRSFGFPGAEDIGNMFQFYRDFEKDFVEARSVDESRSLNPELQSFDTWLGKNKAKLAV